MHWLVVSIFLGFGFVQLFKGSQRRGEYAPVVVSTNYTVLSLAIGAYLALTGGLTFSPAILKVGISIGTAFIVSMLTMTYALTVAGVSPVITSFRLSMLVPIALGVWIWNEPITSTQLAGIALAIVALALMSGNESGDHHLRGTKAFAIIIAIFMIQGIGMTLMRGVHYAGLDPHRLNVLAVIGATAGLLGSIFVIIRNRRPSRNELLVGAGIGLYNGLALSVVLTALSVVPGTVYFPIAGCSIVLLDNLFAHFYWQEPLSKPGIAGVGLAMGAIALVM